jgi:nucleoside-diphosphate-sugar epimerase
MWWDDSVKDLRCHGSTGMTHIQHQTRFDDIRNLNRCNRHADVVINMLGPSRYHTHMISEFKSVNIEYARNIARSARLSGVKKLIHFSACGVSEKSESLDFRTKFIAEEVVRDEFPDAIIIRPTIVLSRKDYYMYYFQNLINYWTSFIPVFDDCSALKQPIIVDDFVEAIVNAIKLDGLEGQTFEIGGPHQYTQLEIIEMMMTGLQRKVTVAHINRKLAMTVSKYWGFNMFNREDIIKSQFDIIVKQENGEKNIHDLFVQPGSIVPFINSYCHVFKDPIALTKEQYEE